MSRSLHIQTTILPGHRIEVVSPDLPVGELASVYVELGPVSGRMPLCDVLASYQGGQLFQSAEEVNAYLKAERDAWEN